MMKQDDFSLLTPELQKLFALFDGQLYLVGGCVRDFLAKKPLKDIDMATPLLPQQAAALLEKEGYRTIPTGLKHGTLTFLTPSGQSIELTTFRTDLQTDGRHATVAFGASLAEDAARRDFTINALYMDRYGHILNPVGGLRDLKKGRIRFIGTARERIKEDALRILRFFRFWGRFAKGKPDQQALAAICDLKGLLCHLSTERKQEELFKILALPNAGSVLGLMEKTGVLPLLLKHRHILALKKLIVREKRAGVVPDVLLRLWVLCQGKPPAFVFSNEQKRMMKILTEAFVQPFETFVQKKAVLYRYGVRAFKARLLLDRKSYPFAAWQFYTRLPVPQFPITAQDIMDHFGVTGADIGLKLRQAEQIWISLGFEREKEVVFAQMSL